VIRGNNFGIVLDFMRSDAEGEGPYQVVVEQEEDGVFVATSPALPGYVAYGQSEAAAVRKLRKAIRRNLEGFAEDWVRASRAPADRTSSHRARLHFGLPLTTTAKLVLGSMALAGAAGLVRLAYRLRRD
jgi:predicted RNase H-like HicB family nuclease